MGKNWPSLDPVEDELVREVTRVHEEAFGRPATNLQVGIEETFVAVVMDVELTPAEAEMVQIRFAKSELICGGTTGTAVAGTYISNLESKASIGGEEVGFLVG